MAILTESMKTFSFPSNNFKLWEDARDFSGGKNWVPEMERDLPQLHSWLGQVPHTNLLPGLQSAEARHPGAGQLLPL